MPEPDRRRASAASPLDRALEAALAAPTPTVMTFGELGLPASLVDTLQRGGVSVPFPIQAQTVPDALTGLDVLGRAQTGSGKTLAFGLPLLARLAASTERREKAPRGLVLVPTRELARQVAEALAPLAHALDLGLMAVYGGAPIGRQIDRLRHGVDVVVATPGRLIDLLDRAVCTLHRVEITVLDEADHMADLGFVPAVTRILDATPPSGQRMLFSATLDRDVARLVATYLTEPVIHAVAPAAAPLAVDHRVFVLTAKDKVTVAAEIAAGPGRTLFFVRTKHGADRLAKQLARLGVQATPIHGNLNQNRRDRALAGFVAGRPRVLVATDVAARGLHVDHVDLVVHFDPPNDHKGYLHRSGRTARAGARGTVVALILPTQVRDLARLQDAAGVTSTSQHVQAGHQAVREVATVGTPVPPPQPPSNATPDHSRRPRRTRATTGSPRRSHRASTLPPAQARRVV